jgi:hypothetical protein
MVYARWQWGATFTARCWGTKRLEQALGDVKVLGPSDAWKGKVYDRLKEMCMGRRDTSCCLDSVKAMSRGAYLPEPEKGCDEGTIPDRLRCSGSYQWCLPISESEKRLSKPH